MWLTRFLENLRGEPLRRAETIRLTELDLALDNALLDPRAAPHFFRLLLRSKLLLVGRLPGPRPMNELGRIPYESCPVRGTKLDIMILQNQGRNRDQSVIPFFTSEDRIDAAGLNRSTPIEVSAEEAFRMIPEGTLAVLNPRSPCFKYFTVEEIRSLSMGCVPVRLQSLERSENTGLQGPG